MKAVSIRKRVRRVSKEVGPLELNSLMDILIIMLVFLIMNFTISEVVLSIPQNIKIPDSQSLDMIKNGVQVQVSDDLEVWINDEKISTEGASSQLWPLKVEKDIVEKLMEIKNQLRELNLQSSAISDESKVVNLIMDKNVSYEHIEKIMNFSTQAGFEEFKFIVIEENL